MAMSDSTDTFFFFLKNKGVTPFLFKLQHKRNENQGDSCLDGIKKETKKVKYQCNKIPQPPTLIFFAKIFVPHMHGVCTLLQATLSSDTLIQPFPGLNPLLLLLLLIFPPSTLPNKQALD